MRIALLTCYLLLVTSAHALTDAWTTDVAQHTAIQRTYKRGEEWTLRVTLRNGLATLPLTNSTAVFCWYTNATANVWWTNACTVTGSSIETSWTPAMDTGASSYPYWIGVWLSGATTPLWRISGTIRILGSPGLSPNALPLPVFAIDFASTSYTNAPWLTLADWQSGSNALATAVSDITAMFGPIWTINQNLNAHFTNDENPHGVSAAQIGAYPASNPSNYISAAQLPQGFRLWSDTADTNVFATLENGTGYVWRAGTSNSTVKVVTLSADFAETVGGTRPAWTNHVFPVTDGAWTFSDYGDDGGTVSGPNGSYWDCAPQSPPYDMAGNPPGAGVASVAWVQIPCTNLVSRFALTNEVPNDLSVAATFTFANTQPTNLELRMSASNDYLVVEHVIP